MKAKGYTLIEILMVMAVVALLFGVGYAGYRDFSRRQALAGAIKVIQGDLRQAQQFALSGKKPDAGCPTLDGISFEVAEPNTYSINYICSGINAGEMKSETLSSDISLVNSHNPLVFRVLGLGTNIESSGSALITLTQTSTGRSSTIIVGAGGDIR